jgi:hypothetical protein
MTVSTAALGEIATVAETESVATIKSEERQQNRVARFMAWARAGMMG